MGKPAGSSGKRALLAAFEALLSERAVALRETRDAARAGMRVDAGHRPTNRGERAAVTSQGYLAAGLNARLEEFEGALADLSRIDGACRPDKVLFVSANWPSRCPLSLNLGRDWSGSASCDTPSRG